MPLVTVFNDPAGINEKAAYPLDTNAILMDWLIDMYGEEGFKVPTTLYKNGFISDETAIDMESFLPDGYPMQENDHIVIVHSPLGLDPITIFAIAVIVSTAAALLLVPNVPSPTIPEQDRPTESPNNRLTGQTNIARPLQRIPDIYGKNKVWPDLIAKTYFEFISNRKYVTEFLCIGRGEFLVEDIKSGITLITDIPAAEATVFGPSTAPAVILDVTESTLVDGLQIFAPNASDVLDFNATGAFSGSTIIGATTQGMDGFFGFNNGDTFDITGTVSNNSTFTFLSATSALGLTTVTVSETFTTETPAVAFNAKATAAETSTSGPFAVPGGTEEVWFDLLFPGGLGDRTSGSMVSLTLEFDLILERLDAPGGSVIGTETTTVFVTGSTIDQVFNTYKVTASFPGDPYQATVERKTNTTVNANFLDNSKWGRMAGVEDLGGINFGNVTTVLVVTKATEQATRASERKFNAIVTRKLRSYDTGTQMITPALTATTKMADAQLEHETDEFLGNKSTSEIDLDGLYEIQDDLTGDAIYGDSLGKFSYSFSDRQVSVGDEMATIANAARAFVYRDGNVFRFGRDETKANRTTQFNGRVKKPNGESKTRHLQKPLDFDGIELQWVAEDSNDAETILFPEGGSPENPKKIEAAGIKDYDQAWNRANVEFLKLKYIRETVKTSVNKRGLLLIPNDRVGNVDGTNIKAQGGEVKGFSGLEIETSDPVDFQGGGTAFVYINDESGEPSDAIGVTPRGDALNGFVLDSPLSFTPVLRGDNDNQIASLYNFFIDSDDKTAKDYTIQEIKPRSDGYVDITMSTYNDAIYAPDTETPTAQA